MSVSQSPLLRLPRELRDRIYHYALLQLAIKSRERDIAFEICYGRYQAGMHRPRWMLANKQILSEAVTQFYRHAHLRIHYANTGDRASRYHNPVFSIGRLETLELQMFLHVKTEVQEDGSKIAHVVPDRKYLDFDPGLRIILKSMQYQKSNLNALSIRFDIGVDDMAEETIYKTFPNPADIKDWKIDLSYLEAWGKSLEKVVLTLGESQIRIHPDYQQLAAYSLVVPLVQRELIRLAKSMIGGHGGSIKDYMSYDTYWNVEARPRASETVNENLSHLGLTAWREFEYDERGKLYKLQLNTDDGYLDWKCEKTNTYIKIPKQNIP